MKDIYFHHRIGRSLAIIYLMMFITTSGFAQEAQIRKNIAERLPDFPAINQVIKSSVAGLYELNVGSVVYYTDAHGDHLIRGSIFATKTKTDLTAQRIEELSAVPFSSLPLNDALTWKHGNGERKLAVFSDPNCVYCKRLERELEQLQNVTLYIFPYPVLGPDSEKKSNAVLCSADPAAAWRSWMLNGVQPEATDPSCDSASLQRNITWGKKYQVAGTPAIFFEDGKRVPGSMNLMGLEKKLNQISKPDFR